MVEQRRQLDWRHRAMDVVDPRHGLWRLVPSPLIAALHFTVCYIATSVHCVRSGSGELGDVRLALAGLTLLAVAAIGVCAWIAWRRLRLVRKSTDGQAGHRDQVEFLARITLYLANLSWVGVLFVAAPLMFFGSCR